MAYRHGVYASEIPSAVTPPVVSSAVPVVFGTAPVNLSTRSAAPVNEPVLCFSYAEAVAAFGYSEDWSFTLSEVIYSHFALYGMAPLVLVNVLDPTVHNASETGQSVSVVNEIATIKQQGILQQSVVVKSNDGETTFEIEDDYTLDFDRDRNLNIQVVPGGAAANASSFTVDFTYLDPSAVDKDDIIGGIVGGQPTGFELINQVFPRFRMLPSMILAPGFTDDPEVAAVQTAKAGNINGLFKAVSLTDIPADQDYTAVPAWKNSNSYTSERQINTWPKVQLGERVYHLSTQLAGVMCATDTANGGVPFVSPSNQSLQATASVMEDGTPSFLGPDQAAYLNGEGIVTALNFVGGWKAWGNRTGAYPGVTDPKDSFIPIRRMMDWIANNIILSAWQRIDSPITPRLIEAITDSRNIWLNGLAAQGVILGGRVEFLESENPQTDLMDGIVRFHLYVAPPGPAREIDFVVEYDAGYLSGLIAA